MSYFKAFPKTFYQYGGGSERVLTQNLSAYADILDEVKEAAAFYQDYYIRDGERPDHVADTLYGNPELHWVLYLMNDNIRQSGWPLSNKDLTSKILEDFNNEILITRDPELYLKFNIGQEVYSYINSQDEIIPVGTVVHRDLDLGQLTIEVREGSFIGKTSINGQTLSGLLTMELTAAVAEYNAPHHYVDGDGEVVDIDPYSVISDLVTPVTNTIHYVQQNDALRKIRVLRPANVNTVVKAFRDAVKSQ